VGAFGLAGCGLGAEAPCDAQAPPLFVIVNHAHWERSHSMATLDDYIVNIREHLKKALEDVQQDGGLPDAEEHIEQAAKLFEEFAVAQMYAAGLRPGAKTTQ
jgi:hypothetical protein